MTHSTPSPAAVALRETKFRAVYDKLAHEGGGTWATYMMMDIAEACAEAADPSEVHRLFKHAWARFSCLADEAMASDDDAQRAMCEVDAGMMQEGMALAATLTALETAVAAPWLPIDSAPKDGTEILGYWSGGRTHALVCWSGDGWWKDCADNCMVNAPTHWKRLDEPAPPTEG